MVRGARKGVCAGGLGLVAYPMCLSLPHFALTLTLALLVPRDMTVFSKFVCTFLLVPVRRASKYELTAL